MANIKLIKGILLMLVCTFFSASGQFFLKLGTKNLMITFSALITNYYLIIGLLFYTFGGFILIYALKHGELSVIYPVISVTYIWVIILSAVFLQEHLGIYKIIGTTTILSGVSFILKGGSS